MRKGQRFYSDAARWTAFLMRGITRGPKAIKIKRSYGGKFNHDQENSRRVRQVHAGILQMSLTGWSWG
jgi:hypothetical protein